MFSTHRLKYFFAALFLMPAGMGLVALTPTEALAASGSLADCPRVSYGDKSKCVQLAQQRLAAHGYMPLSLADGKFGKVTRTAVKTFQRDKKLEAVGSVGSKTRAALLRAPKVIKLPKRCTKVAKSLCISKHDRKLRYVVNGKVQMTLDARFGDARGKEFVTPEGTHKVVRKEKNSWSYEYNGPMPYSMYFTWSGHAVHYSSDFAAYGYSGASHGCVNIRDLASLKWLYSKVPKNTRVVVY